MCGIVVCHRLIQYFEENVSALKGTVVIIPSLNPTGLLGQKREPLTDPTIDPNRKWPDSYKNPADEQSHDWLASVAFFRQC